MEALRLIRAIVVDDESDVILNLTHLLGKHCSQIEICDSANSVPEALVKIKKHAPDLLFLDIELPGKNGFDLLDAIHEKNFYVIFITSYNQHAIRAFRYSALDFLLKPIDINELKEAASRAIERILHQPDQKTHYQILSETLTNAKPKRIGINTNKGTIFIAISDIVALEADGAYTTLDIVGQDRLVSSKTIGEFEEILDGLDFLRVHNSFIINLDHIRKYTKNDGGSIALSNDRTIPVSRRRKSLFENRIKRM